MDATAQWADSLLLLERLYFLKLALWAALSVAVATLLVAVSQARSSPMIRSLAFTLGGVGISLLAFALIARSAARLRDLASATTLDRVLWLVAGLMIGWTVVAIGTALPALRRVASERARRVAGAAIGIAAHGAAIAMLSLQLASALVR